MSLPTSYMSGSFTKIPQYFDTMLTAKAPDKFTTKFMGDLGFTSSNDRQFVNVLKSIGFLDDAGTPTKRYFRFLDQSNSKHMVAEGIREAYEDLFALNTSAYKLTKDEVVGKFKTLTNGTKENVTVGYMASTFLNLCYYADWTTLNPQAPKLEENTQQNTRQEDDTTEKICGQLPGTIERKVDLNYDIHIHLPATRDPAVYDALFSSLSKHIPLC